MVVSFYMMLRFVIVLIMLMRVKSDIFLKCSCVRWVMNVLF